MIIFTEQTLSFEVDLATKWLCQECFHNTETRVSCTHWRGRRLFYVDEDQARLKWQPWRRQTLTVNSRDFVGPMESVDDWTCPNLPGEGVILRHCYGDGRCICVGTNQLVWLTLHHPPHVTDSSTGENLMNSLPGYKQSCSNALIGATHLLCPSMTTQLTKSCG